MTSNYVKAVVVDKQDRIWVGTEAGLNSISPEGLWSTQTPANSGLPREPINALAVDRQGRAWLATNSGIGVLSPDGSWKGYKKEEYGTAGIESDAVVEAVVIDSLDRVWIGTDWTISVFDSSGQWTRYSNGNAGVPLTLTAMTIDGQDRIWKAHYGGLGILDANFESGQASATVAAIRMILGWMGGAAFLLTLSVIAVADLTPERIIRQFIIGLAGTPILNAAVIAITVWLQPPCSGFGECFGQGLLLLALLAGLNIIVLAIFVMRRKWGAAAGLGIALIVAIAFWVLVNGWRL